jgi:hypothetical protein
LLPRDYYCACLFSRLVDRLEANQTIYAGLSTFFSHFDSGTAFCWHKVVCC